MCQEQAMEKILSNLHEILNLEVSVLYIIPILLGGFLAYVIIGRLMSFLEYRHQLWLIKRRTKQIDERIAFLKKLDETDTTKRN
jgi:hypothetical protein